MTQIYFNPKRESDPYALPDGEVFYHDSSVNTIFENGESSHFGMPTGWYWWPCYPGCLPDSPPQGPFATEAEAIKDAQKE
jgi:hypothetical protein